MPLLPSEDLDELFHTTIAAGLLSQREALFAQVDRHFVASLRTTPAANAQLLMDLNAMNEGPELTNGSVPMEQWLSQAVLLSAGRQHQSTYQRALAKVRVRIQGTGPGSGGSMSDPRPRRGHFLDEASMDFARAETQSLAALLEEEIFDRDEIVHVVDNAGILKGRIRFDKGSRVAWHDVLSAAASQGKARRLVRVIADDPERSALKERLEELLSDSPSGEAGPRALDWKTPQKASGKERVLGAKATWVDVQFLRKGADCARSVVRLTASFGDSSFLGTGFFIAPGIVLTNHHVLFEDGTRASADEVELCLDYEIPWEGKIGLPKIVHVDHPRIEGDAQLDWAVVFVDDPAVADLPWLKLGSKARVSSGDFVSIIQHPHGLPKKLGIFRNEVRHVDRKIIQYSTDTEAGSSGSPVLNARWEVVALHRQWTRVDLPDGTREVRNEGVAIDRVIEGLQSKGIVLPSPPKGLRAS